jgi:hypothetical protein
VERGHGAWWSPISPGKPGARGDIPIGLSRPEYREVRGYLERMGARPRYPPLRRDRPCPRLEHAGPGHIRGQGLGALRSGDEDRHRGRRHGHRCRCGEGGRDGRQLGRHLQGPGHGLGRLQYLHQLRGFGAHRQAAPSGEAPSPNTSRKDSGATSISTTVLSRSNRERVDMFRGSAR